MGATLALDESHSGKPVEARVSAAGYGGAITCSHTPLWTPGRYVDQQVWVDGYMDTVKRWCDYDERLLQCTECGERWWDTRCLEHESGIRAPNCSWNCNAPCDVIRTHTVSHYVSEQVWIEGYYETESVWVDGYWS